LIRRYLTTFNDVDEVRTGLYGRSDETLIDELNVLEPNYTTIGYTTAC